MTKTTLEKKWAEETESKSAIEKAYKGKKKNEAASLSPEALDQSVIEQLPAPTGWRLMVLPFKTKKVTDGGIHLVDKALDRQQAATVLGYVLKVGPMAYTGERFSSGPWCQAGDWVLYARYAGSRIDIEGGEIKILNDDEIIATVSDPEAILHNF
jgi:co-chaperonin GroES (HSP10)